MANIISMIEDFDISAFAPTSMAEAVNATAGSELLVHAYIGIAEKTATNGSKYLQIILSDNAKHSISELVFANDGRYSFFEPYIGDRIEAEVALKLVKNGKYVNMSMKNVSLYMPEPVKPEVEAEASASRMDKIKKHIEFIASPFIREVVRNVYNTPGFADKLMSAPATQYSGYAYPGGLADLVITTCDFAQTMALSINENTSVDCGIAVNPDLMLAGALLSHIGKAYMLDWTDEGKTRIEKTEQGIMDNELVIAHNMTDRAIREVSAMVDGDGNQKFNVWNDTCIELLHIIDASKNQTQWGALNPPRTKHAMFMANICQMAFTKGLFEALEARQDGPDGDNRFSKAYDDGRMYFLPVARMDI